MSSLDGSMDVSTFRPAWQRNYFALSPNATLLRTLMTHGGLKQDGIDDPADSPYSTTSSLWALSPIGVIDHCTTKSIPPTMYFLQVIDLLVLRAVQRQCCDLLRLKADDTTSENLLSPLAEEDDLQSYFRLAFEAESLFFGPYPRLDDSHSLPKTMAEMSAHPSATILAPLAHWADTLERQIQAYMSPRIFFTVDKSLTDACKLEPSAIAALRSHPHYGDIIIRVLMHNDCDVHFQHVRVGLGSRSAYAVCFAASEAATWLAKNGYEESPQAARQLLRQMEDKRIIQRITSAYS